MLGNFVVYASYTDRYKQYVEVDLKLTAQQQKIESKRTDKESESNRNNDRIRGKKEYGKVKAKKMCKQCIQCMFFIFYESTLILY